MKRKAKGISNSYNVFNKYIANCKRKNIQFKISKEYFLEITTRNCFYCGKPPSSIMNKKGTNGAYIYNGVDRIDSSKGYEEGNVVACCWKCNKAKSKMEVNEFLSWVESVYNHSIKK